VSGYLYLPIAAYAQLLTAPEFVQEREQNQAPLDAPMQSGIDTKRYFRTFLLLSENSPYL